MKRWLQRWQGLQNVGSGGIEMPGVDAVARGFNASIFVVCGLVVAAAYAMGMFTDAGNLLSMVVLLVLAGLVQVFLVRGWVRSSSAVVLVLLFAGVYSSMLRFGSVSIAQASMAGIPLIYCVIILGERAGLALLLLSVLTSGAITWAQLTGQLESVAPTLPQAQWAILAAGFLVAYRMAVLMKRHLLDASQKVNAAQTMLLMEREQSNARVLKALSELERQRYVIDQHAIVTILDLGGHLTYGNQKFAEISGYAPQEFLGKSLRLVDSGAHDEAYYTELVQTAAKGKVWRAEQCCKAKDGTLFWLDTTVAAFMNPDGKPREYIAVSTDITQQRQAEHSARAASQAKSEFLANMSHEIRTPMNGVVGMVDLLRATELSRDQRRMVGTIHDSSIALLQILNDILDFSKIEADKMQVEAMPTHLRDLVEGVAQLMVTISAGKDLDLALVIDPELPAWVWVDPTRLRQVLYNLVGNALKFSAGRPERRGQVRLQVRAAEQTHGVPVLELSVKDNGIGMAPEQVEHLFEAFTQGDVSTARKFGGTGLGLSISRRLVEMMHGRILVHSTLGQGSIFTVLLPLQVATVGTEAAPALPLRNVAALMLTEDADSALTLPGHLRAAGAVVQSARTLEQASAWMETVVSPAVLVLDVDAPWDAALDHWAQAVPGRGVVRLVRQNQSSLPGVSVTVVARPLLLQELLRGVALACGQISVSTLAHHGAAAARTGPVPVADAVSRNSNADVPGSAADAARADGRLVLLVEDNETNRDVMLEQLRILGYAADTASNGASALAMWKQGQYSLMLTDCHMPQMDGFALTEAIRQHELPNEHMPIIAVTANAMEGELQHCLDHGMDDYLTKPLRLAELGALMGKWLPLSVADSAPRFDPQALGRMVGDDRTMHRRLLDRFVATTTAVMQELSVLQAASDLKGLASAAHRLKSAAHTVGAVQLGLLCQELESLARQGQTAASLQQVVAIQTAFTEVEPLLRAV
jgi:PAS domain S-box-containing protein